MNTISKEFQSNPLLALVPNYGSFKDLASLLSKIQENISILQNEIDTTKTGSNTFDEKKVRILNAEIEMLQVVKEWAGLNLYE